MTRTPRVVEGPYLRDILDQPRALEDTLRRLEATAALEGVARRLRDRELRRVVLTGMGSSHLGLVPLHLRLVEAGLAPAHRGVLRAPPLPAAPARRGHAARARLAVRPQRRDPPAARGRARPRRRDARASRTRPTARSRARRRATVLTHAGEEATVSCKTYLAAQMALAWLGEVLAGGDRDAARAALAETIPGAAAYLASWRSHVEWLAGRLDGVRAVYYTGRGPSLAAACSRRPHHEGVDAPALRGHERRGLPPRADGDARRGRLPARLRRRGAHPRPQRGARRRRARGRRPGLPRRGRRGGAGPAPARGPRPRPAGRGAPAGRDDHARDRGPRRPRGRPLRAGRRR